MSEQTVPSPEIIEQKILDRVNVIVEQVGLSVNSGTPQVKLDVLAAATGIVNNIWQRRAAQAQFESNQQREQAEQARWAALQAITDNPQGQFPGWDTGDIAHFPASEVGDERG